MNRLLTTTAVLALILTPVQPWPLMAQTRADDGSVIADDGTVLCTPTAEAACDLKAIKKQLRKAEKAEKKAAKSEENSADADAAAKAEADAAAQAEADAAAKADADAAAQAAAQAEADAAAQADAAAKAEADAAAQAEAEKQAAAQAEADAAAKADAEKQAADAAQAEAGAAAKSEADAAAQAEADAAAKAEAEKQAADAAQAEAAAAAQAEADAAAKADAEKQAADKAKSDAGVPVQDTATSDPVAPVMPEPEVAPTPEPPVSTEVSDTGTSDQGTEDSGVVQVAVPTEAEANSLTGLLSNPDQNQAEGAALATAAAAALAVVAGTTDAGTTASGDPVMPADETAPVVTETVVTAEDARSSDEDFDTTAAGKKNDKKKKKDKDKDDGLSDFEKVGLVALGALAVGAMINNQDEVVTNTGDRVVIKRNDGTYAVYKDDDALLRTPGSTVKTETFNDGSTRTTVDRADGTKIVTIRDASGRVLRRASFDARGREVVLIDDLAPETKIDVTKLPKPKPQDVTISASDGNAAMRAALRAAETRDLGRSFSLRQVREIAEVRALASTLDVDSITFDSGSAAISTTEADELSELGRFIAGMIRENPNEVFLIEGHTDAVGSSPSNLALSDRRAESVALALTEYFDVPPENLVVQGYGEAELRIETEVDERLNRRVAVRIITPLLQTAALQ